MSKHGLKKEQKVLDRAEFVKLSKHGRRFQDHYFIIAILPNESENSRLGITVTRRVGNAVTRNRLKRLVREWFRLNQSTISGCFNINVIAKKTASGLTSLQVFGILDKLFDQIRGASD